MNKKLIFLTLFVIALLIIFIYKFFPFNNTQQLAIYNYINSADNTKVPPEYVTNSLRPNGFGAQFQHVIQPAVFADLNGLKFAYTPFKSMEHNYDASKDFLAKKEELINFQNNFPLAKEHKNIVKTGQSVDYFESNIEMAAKSEALLKIKTIFRANKPANFFNNNNFNIAVHIGRPNAHDCRLEGADVPDKIFISIIIT